MPGGYTTQILAKLSLISGTHAPVNRRPEHILIFANVLFEPYLQTPPRDLCKERDARGSISLKSTPPKPWLNMCRGHCDFLAAGVFS